MGSKLFEEKWGDDQKKKEVETVEGTHYKQADETILLKLQPQLLHINR